MSRTSEQRKCEEAFAEGVKDGKESNILDQFCQSIAKSLATTKAEESYNAGYKKGLSEKQKLMFLHQQ